MNMLTLQVQMLLQHSVQYAPVIQTRRLRVISQEHSTEAGKISKSLMKHLRAIGKWWRLLISTDPKGFCKLESATAGVGWWWGEVGAIVAGSDGAVANDGA
jgi:hypothetical protein